MIINEEYYAIGVGVLFVIFGIYIVKKCETEADSDDNSISDFLLDKEYVNAIANTNTNTNTNAIAK